MTATAPDLAPRWPDRSRAHVPAAWRAPLLRLGLAWAMLLLAFAGDWAAMAHQWWAVSTYSHILLVPPILLWLVAIRWPQLAEIAPSAWWPGLVPLAGALALWLAGDVAGIDLVSQTGAVAMLPAAVLALLGPRVAAALLFPLSYTIFLVPFGDSLIPSLQMLTAAITIALTRWSGVPAQIEGVFIDTPAGLFEVAEACSGVTFLIAMLALATLCAHLCFRSPLRRAIFMTCALTLPVIANGGRAWGTIYLAQIHGLAFAQGFDHVVYGWIFFAIVIAILLGISWRFFDRDPRAPLVDARRLAASPLLMRLDRGSAPGWPLLIALGALVCLSLVWGARARVLAADVPAQLFAPAIPGWTMVDYRPAVPWMPRASGADHRLLVRYRDARGREVDLFFALYGSQGEGREASGFGQGALVPGGVWRWLEPAPAPMAGRGDWLQAHGQVRRLAYSWYRTGDLLTGSNARLRLATGADRLMLRANPTAMLILSAEQGEGPAAAEALRAFIDAAGPLAQRMDRMAQIP